MAHMGAALGLAAMIIVFSIFLPSILRALEEFLLQFFHMATDVLRTIEIRNAQLQR